MSDAQTIGIYDARAVEYADLTSEGATQDRHLVAFMASVPDGGRVLDLGCGPGAAAAQMAAAGFEVVATDASAEMVALAARAPGVRATQATFDDLSGENLYDGVWANFSLLHAPRQKMPAHLAAIHRALRPGGVFHIGVKLGEGSARDRIGRLYTYYGEDELAGLLADAGFTVTDRSRGRDKGLDGTLADWVCLRAHG